MAAAQGCCEHHAFGSAIASTGIAGLLTDRVQDQDRPIAEALPRDVEEFHSAQTVALEAATAFGTARAQTVSVHETFGAAIAAAEEAGVPSTRAGWFWLRAENGPAPAALPNQIDQAAAVGHDALLCSREGRSSPHCSRRSRAAS